MIIFENVSSDHFTGVSFTVADGTVCSIVCAKRHDKDHLLGLMTAMTMPSSGRIAVSGIELSSASPKDLAEARIKTGIAHQNGGLISNLKVWENIALPAWYHKGMGPSGLEERATELAARLGFSNAELEKFMSGRPAGIGIREKKAAGMIRAMLMEPEIMIYDSVFDDLDETAAEAFSDAAIRYHSEKPGRISLLLSTDEAIPAGISPDMFLRQDGRRLI